MLAQVSAQSVDGGLRYNPHPGIGIEVLSMQVEGDLDAPAFDIRQRVRQAGMRAMQPYRHFRRPESRAACRGAKKKHLLPRGENALAQQTGKDLRQPRAATEDEC